jgi:hypothetical protein
VTLDELLADADTVLYQAKRRRVAVPRQRSAADVPATALYALD